MKINEAATKLGYLQFKDFIKRKEKLLPCPFCGGDASLTEAMGEWWVKCVLCDASAAMESTKEKALTVWNKRVCKCSTSNKP